MADNCKPINSKIVIAEAEQFDSQISIRYSNITHDVPIFLRRTERIRMSTMNVKTYQKANSISAAAAPACERFNIRPSDSSAELRHPKRYSRAPEPRNEMTSKIRRLTDIGHGRLDGLIPIATTSSVLVRHCLQDSPLIGPLCHKSSRAGMMQMMQMPPEGQKTKRTLSTAPSAEISAVPAKNVWPP